MKKSIILIFSTLFLLSCIKEQQTGSDLAAGDRIPDFSVIMNDGTEITGRELRQGMACIVFFTTKCPDCQRTLPDVQRLYEE